jgi:alkanesulfonate monooxygenase SsuD/methylene tetrahydromethanopterin reductase-like flavin-dependent oxidoreductase (luciferase family)
MTRFGFFVMGSRDGSYADVLDQAARLEELRFDTVVLGERHFRHASLLYPSAFSAGAASAARTERLRIGTAGRVLSLDHPLHVAEDAATLDVLSGGRLDFGATRASLDDQAHRVFGAPIEGATARFTEALDIIRAAWTRESFTYEGAHHAIPEVSVFPRPVQQPHPPIYLVAVSPERLEFAAREGYSAYVGAIRSIAELASTCESYWSTLAEAGHDRHGVELSVNRFVYVSADDERARSEFERPFMKFMAHRAPDLRAALVAKYGDEGELRFRRFLDDFLIVGGPDTVTSRLSEMLRAVDTGYLLVTLNFVTLDHALCKRSTELFAREVMPGLRQLDPGASRVPVAG